MPPPAYMPYPPMYSSNILCILDPYMPPVPPSTSNQPLPINPNEFTSNQRSMISYPNNTGSNRGYGEYVHQPGSTVGYEYGSGNYPPLPYGYYPPPFSSTLPPPPSPYGYQQPVFFLAFFCFFCLVTYILEATNLICYLLNTFIHLLEIVFYF